MNRRAQLPKWRSLPIPALVVVAGLCSGCSNDGLRLGQVSGKVTLDGKPVPKAFITFDPQFEGRPSVATSDENGNYELLFNPSKGGALVGEHHVRLSTYDLSRDDKVTPEVIPNAYRGTNGFIPVTINSGKNVIDFELKSVPTK